MKKCLGRLVRVCLRLGAIGVVTFLVAWFAFPLNAEKIEAVQQGVILLDRQGNVLRRTLSDEERDSMPVGREEVGSWSAAAIISAEDKRFYRHCGIDPVAILRSSVYNLHQLDVVTGASTLSTQVIRMVEPRDRTVLTKLIEGFRALQMEQKFSKEEILLQYLNRMPMGGNVYGIETGSRRYFGKSASELSLGETAMLMGLPQSPSRYRPDRHLSLALERRNYVLGRMVADGVISEETREAEEEQAMQVSRHHAPFLAPHFCDWLLLQSPPAGEICTTLDPDLQLIAEQSNSRGAIVILEVATGSILAMAGSPDYNDAAAHGRVNGALARRSPGSTLKPFAYALGLEQGLITPDTRLGNAQRTYKDYVPSNFDRRFTESVKAEYALKQSLNIPALEMVGMTGLQQFYAVLQQVGMSTIDRSVGHYGLSLALGTCEVRLLDLVNAYAMFARGGDWMPWRVRPERLHATSKIFSDGTCYLLADMMSEDDDAIRMAWKTGTSNGYKDAWTIAYNPEYVVGVWIGKADGSSSQDFVGARSALPVARKVFRRLYPGGKGPWFKRPDTVRTRPVCVETGLSGSERCTHTEDGSYIIGQSSPHRCRHTEADTPLVIVSPPPESCYQLSGDRSDWTESISLKVRGAGEDAVFWFINGERYHADTWALERGRHEFRCVDSKGRSDFATVVVN